MRQGWPRTVKLADLSRRYRSFVETQLLVGSFDVYVHEMVVVAFVASIRPWRATRIFSQSPTVLYAWDA